MGKQGKSLFDDIEIFEGDSHEVKEEKAQKKELLQSKIDRLKKNNEFRQQELEDHNSKKAEEDLAKKERIQKGLAALNMGKQ
jgi:hypothetical protein